MILVDFNSSGGSSSQEIYGLRFEKKELSLEFVGQTQEELEIDFKRAGYQSNSAVLFKSSKVDKLKLVLLDDLPLSATFSRSVTIDIAPKVLKGLPFLNRFTMKRSLSVWQL